MFLMVPRMYWALILVDQHLYYVALRRICNRATEKSLNMSERKRGRETGVTPKPQRKGYANLLLSTLSCNFVVSDLLAGISQ